MTFPKFWKTNNFISTLLLPISWIYSLVSYLRYTLINPKFLKAPVICVGNVTVGGAGKTPTVIWLAREFQALGYKVHILSRGYKVKIYDPVLVDPKIDSAAQVGDEPLLLARVAPTWVGKDRVQAARRAIKAGAELILMDDGLQNPCLFKDFSLIVIDGMHGVFNNQIMPAGPLRERLIPAFLRTNATLIIGKDHTNITSKLSHFSGKSLFHAKIKATTNIPVNQPLIAFAGIGQPAKFFRMLESAGATLAKTKSYPDHHAYTDAEIEALLQEAEQLNATLITTEKDLVKVPVNLRENILSIPIKLSFEEDEKASFLEHISKCL